MPPASSPKTDQRYHPAVQSPRRRRGTGRPTPTTDQDLALQGLNKKEANDYNYKRISNLLRKYFPRPHLPDTSDHGHPVNRYISNGRNGDLTKLGVWFDTCACGGPPQPRSDSPADLDVMSSDDISRLSRYLAIREELLPEHRSPKQGSPKQGSTPTARPGDEDLDEDVVIISQTPVARLDETSPSSSSRAMRGSNSTATASSSKSTSRSRQLIVIWLKNGEQPRTVILPIESDEGYFRLCEHKILLGEIGLEGSSSTVERLDVRGWAQLPWACPVLLQTKAVLLRVDTVTHPSDLDAYARVHLTQYKGKGKGKARDAD